MWVQSLGFEDRERAPNADSSRGSRLEVWGFGFGFGIWGLRSGFWPLGLGFRAELDPTVGNTVGT